MINENKYLMPRIESLMASREFQYYISKIEKLEQDRIYCGHDIDHLLSVARIMYIINLEDGLGLDKELIYAVGLLHDIGRVDEYEKGIDHHVASCKIADKLMQDAGFSSKEIDISLYAIDRHRSCKEEVATCGTENNSPKNENPKNENQDNKRQRLADLLRYVDKKSRLCYYCGTRDTCKWSDDKKNKRLLI